MLCVSFSTLSARGRRRPDGGAGAGPRAGPGAVTVGPRARPGPRRQNHRNCEGKSYPLRDNLLLN